MRPLLVRRDRSGDRGGDRGSLNRRGRRGRWGSRKRRLGARERGVGRNDRARPRVERPAQQRLQLKIFGQLARSGRAAIVDSRNGRGVRASVAMLEGQRSGAKRRGRRG